MATVLAYTLQSLVVRGMESSRGCDAGASHKYNDIHRHPMIFIDATPPP